MLRRDGDDGDDDGDGAGSQTIGADADGEQRVSCIVVARLSRLETPQLTDRSDG